MFEPTPAATRSLLQDLISHLLLREVSRLDLASALPNPGLPQLTFASISTLESAGISSSGISYRFCESASAQVR